MLQCISLRDRDPDQEHHENFIQLLRGLSHDIRVRVQSVRPCSVKELYMFVNAQVNDVMEQRSYSNLPPPLVFKDFSSLVTPQSESLTAKASGSKKSSSHSRKGSKIGQTATGTGKQSSSRPMHLLSDRSAPSKDKRSNKYCQFHNTYNHTDFQCRSQQSSPPDSSGKSVNRNFRS